MDGKRRTTVIEDMTPKRAVAIKSFFNIVISSHEKIFQIYSAFVLVPDKIAFSKNINLNLTFFLHSSLYIKL